MQGFNKVRLAPASCPCLTASADGTAFSRFSSSPPTNVAESALAMA